MFFLVLVCFEMVSVWPLVLTIKEAHNGPNIYSYNYNIILYILFIHLYSDYVLRVCMVAQAGWLDQMSQRGVGSQWEWSVGPAICHLNALDRFCIESVLQFYTSSVQLSLGPANCEQLQHHH